MICTLIYKGQFSGEIHRKALEVQDQAHFKHLLEEMRDYKKSYHFSTVVVDYEITTIEIIMIMYTASVGMFEYYELVACAPDRG